MNSLYNTILSPIITEKATKVSEKNQFVFKVKIDSNKGEIKKAIEKLFKVKVKNIKTIKIKVSRTEFLNNPELQEEAMLKLLRYNKKKLQKYIDKFDGQTVNGILVTESGLLAAAHLGGAGSVKKWFRTGKVRKDGNGVKITNYMERFSGYNLYL